jgi:hypothetical protein
MINDGLPVSSTEALKVFVGNETTGISTAPYE